MMAAVSDDPRELYIELVKESLTCSRYEANDGTVFEQFEGLPKPGAGIYPADKGDRYSNYNELAVSLEQVGANPARYRRPDHQVQFLKGSFKAHCRGRRSSDSLIEQFDGLAVEAS
jgi:hypothetical protein